MRIDIPTPVTLNADFDRFRADDHVFAILNFGNAEITRWDVTDRRAEFEPQPGDYWDTEDRERHEQSWLSEYVARRLGPIFEGAAVSETEE